MRIVVVGGGIGGLTAAVALRNAGCDVVVLERAERMTAVGFGLVLQANAMAALTVLGIDADVEAVGVPVRGGRITSFSGRRIRGFERSGEVLGIGIHRAELQAILLRHASPDCVRWGAQVVDAEPLGDSIVARAVSGEEVVGDLLVGADGIHSAVRARLLGDGPPRYAGYTCWRGLTDHAEEFERGKVFEIWGPGKRFGGVHVDERLYWFAPVNAAPGGIDKPGHARHALLAQYEGWPEPVLRTIASTPEAAVLRNDILDRPFRTPWGRGRATLLGDAAHPMTPDMGQGACQAIEDAVVLGRCVRGASDPTAALRRYERLRLARTRRFVVRSRLFGQIAQWEGSTARRVRDAVLRATPDFVVRQDLNRTLRFSLPGGPP